MLWSLATRPSALLRTLNQPKLSYLLTTTLGVIRRIAKDRTAARKQRGGGRATRVVHGVAGQRQEQQLFLASHIRAYHDLINLFVGQGLGSAGLTEDSNMERAKARTSCLILAQSRARPKMH
jgi:hypothetical protein